MSNGVKPVESPKGGSNKLVAKPVEVTESAIPDELLDNPIPRPESNFARTERETHETSNAVKADYIRSTMDEYVLSFNGSKSDEEMAKAQVSLYNFLKKIITNSNQKDFRHDWSKIINYVNESPSIGLVTFNKGTRFFNLDRADQKAYSTLTYLILTKCDKKVGYVKPGTGNYIDDKKLNENLSILGTRAIDNISAFYNI